MPASRRPYRSHKTPACDRCRRFKRRCSGGGENEPCVLCKLQDVPCVPSDLAKASASHRNQKGKPSKQRHNPARNQRVFGDRIQDPLAQADSAHTRGDQEPNGHDTVFGGDLNAESSIVVSPVLTEDIRALDRYFSASTTESGPSRTNEGMESSLVYVKVPRRREGLAIARNPGFMQKEIMWQIIRPYAGELLRSYFHKFHPAFPILDQKAFVEIFESGAEKISPALFCEFFATTLTLWDHCGLRKHPKPDYTFIWNLAVEALNQDFLAPGLSTVCSVLLDMTGRPIFSVIGNTVNNGRAVALARSLGLNHDPSSWKRPTSEKSLRIRLWWAVLIHDYWSSFSHGVPQNTTNRQHDVPVPNLGDLTSDGEPEDASKAFGCFIHLCTLSVILGEMLPLVYDLKTNSDDTWKQIRRLESELDTWENTVSLPLYGPNETYPSPVSGLTSLCFCHLSLRMLICRVAFRAANRSHDPDRENNTQYHLARLRQSAQDIATYFCSLQKDHFQEFWLCYSAHILTFTFIILLRCTVESSDEATIQSCKSSVVNFWAKLQDAAEIEGWDLAGMCISRCTESMDKIGKIWDVQEDDVALSGGQVPPGDAVPDVEGQDGALQGCEVSRLEALVPGIPPFSSLDLWLDNSSDAFWGEVDMGSTFNNYDAYDSIFGGG